MTESITLARKETGDTTITVTLRMDAGGTLWLGGQDLGCAVERHFGDFEYEYDVFVSPKHKGALLLALWDEARGSGLLNRLVGPLQRAADRKRLAQLSQDERDRQLLELLERRYSGDLHAYSHFKEWLDRRHLMYQTWSRVGD